MTAPLLEVKNLKKHFPLKGGFLGRVSAHVRAVDGVSFSIRQGETLALVGEFGMRQVDGGQSHPAPFRCDRRRGRARGPPHRQPQDP